VSGWKSLPWSQDWGYSERFPRVTLCEFEIRYQSRVHNYIVQCVLTINLFNEKIFMFLWFWFIFLAGATAVNFLRWLFRALYWPGHDSSMFVGCCGT